MTSATSHTNHENVVAVFDTEAHADAAVRDLKAAGVPDHDISRHARDTMGGDRMETNAPVEQGFWGRLFGTEPPVHDRAVYDRTVESGGAVVAVRIQGSNGDGSRVLEILERHNPIDVDERAAHYGLAGTGATVGARTEPARTGVADNGNDQVVQLSEEHLEIGKRAVNRGTTRLRRYTVETPIEENVTLRDETVSIERRPVSGSHAVGADAFTDRTVEMTETREEAVVAKTARVTEELVIHKDVSERVEAVRDTVRRDEVEVEKVPGTARNTDYVDATGAKPARPSDPRAPKI